MDELPARASNLPDAVVGVAPMLLEPSDHPSGGVESFGRRRHAELTGAVDRVGELSVHVELQLSRGGVPDPYGGGALVPREPLELVLVEATFSRDAVHDLQVLGVAGHGSDHPVAPPRRLVDVPGGHQGVERERRVPDPAEPIVPVPHPAEELGERGRRRGHDAPRRLVRERLQRDEGALDLVLPSTLVRRTTRPVAPPSVGLVDGLERVDRRRRILPRRVPGEHEPHALSFVHDEARVEALTLDGDRHIGPELHRFRAGTRVHDGARSVDPRSGLPVVESRYASRGHRHRATQPLHDADQARVLLPGRHAVDDANSAVGGLELRLEHQRPGPIRPGRSDDSLARGDDPRSVLISAEQAGEACGGVESRQAQPVDRAVAAHERRRMRVADQCVVLDAKRHHVPPMPPRCRPTTRLGLGDRPGILTRGG